MTQISYRAVISVPANNTTMEPELNALLPEFAPFAVARVKLPSSTLTVEDLPAYTRNTLDSLGPFLSQRLELVVYGCTAAGFLAGPAASARIIEAMRVQSGAVVVGTGAAMADVLKHEGVRETAVVTPYLQAVNDGLRAYLASAGIAVEVLNSFECRTTEELGRIDEASGHGLGAAHGNAAQPGLVHRLLAASHAQHPGTVAPEAGHSRLVVDQRHGLGRCAGDGVNAMEYLPPRKETKRPKLAVPPLACDCHSHIFGPDAQYPYTPNRSFTPHEALIPDYLAMLSTLGVERSVVVQASVYGSDNRCTASAVMELGLHRARGIAMVDENVSKESLRTLDASGIRGTRFITTVKGGPSLDNLPGVARKIAEFGWHIEMYVPRHLWRNLFPVLKTLPVPVVFDHMGGMSADTTDDDPDLKGILALLESGKCWVKLCGYRASLTGTSLRRRGAAGPTLRHPRAGALRLGHGLAAHDDSQATCPTTAT